MDTYEQLREQLDNLIASEEEYIYELDKLEIQWSGGAHVAWRECRLLFIRQAEIQKKIAQLITMLDSRVARYPS